jgi:hypothetical protein
MGKMSIINNPEPIPLLHNDLIYLAILKIAQKFSALKERFAYLNKNFRAVKK